MASPSCCNTIATSQNTKCCANQDAALTCPYNIILIKAELYHDIDDDTRQLQVFRKLIDIPISTDERYRYIIDRYIDRAVNHVTTRLSPYIATDKPHRIVNNHTAPWEEHNIYIVMPKKWPADCIDHLKDAIHTYIVRMVEAEVLSLSIGPQDPLVQQYRMDAENADNEVVSIINRRIGPLTAPFTPFG